jgi:hypothetical protein
MNPKAVVGAIAAIAIVAGSLVALSGGKAPVPGVDTPANCHTYEEQKSDACRAYWSAPATVDAGAQ